jgi:hypothetical protein
MEKKKFYSTINQNQQFFAKRHLKNNTVSSVLILREAIRNSIGHNAENILSATLRDKSHHYILIIHDGEKFNNKNEIYQSLETNKSSKSGGGIQGAGGTNSCLLGNIETKEQEVIFFGNTVEDGFVAISQKINVEQDIYVPEDASSYWKNILENLFSDSTNKLKDYNVGYLIKVNKKQLINGNTIPSLSSILNIPEEVSFKFYPDISDINTPLKTKKSLRPFYQKELNNDFCRKFTISVDKYKHEYVDGEKTKNITFDAEITLMVYPNVEIKDEKTPYVLNKNGTSLRQYKNVPRDFTEIGTKLYQDSSYYKNSKRLQEDPIYFSTASPYYYVQNMGLPCPYANSDKKIPVDDKLLTFLNEEFFVEEQDIENITNYSPRVSLSVKLKFNRTKNVKDVVNNLTGGLDEFFMAHNEELIKSLINGLGEEIYENYRENDDYIAYRNFVKELLPPIDNSDFRIPKLNVLKQAAGGNNREYYWEITKRGIKAVNDYINEHDEFESEWKESKSKGGRPQKEGDRIYSAPPNITFYANLINAESGRKVKNVKVSCDEEESIEIKQDVDGEYKIEIYNFYETDDDGNKFSIEEEDYAYKKNQFPKQPKIFLIDGEAKNIGFKIILPKRKTTGDGGGNEYGKPSKNENGKHDEKLEDVYLELDESIFVQFSNNKLYLNKNNPYIEKICKNHKNYPPNSISRFDDFYSEMYNLATEIYLKDGDANLFTLKNSSFTDTEKNKVSNLIKIFGDNDTFRNWYLNDKIKLLIKHNKDAKYLSGLYEKYFENVNDDDFIEKEEMIEELIQS